ncbi:probable prolyl 4-hydroxylase 3 [Zingiber officinale]|uniref:procollagen-proline 4-dioxygenase n=1 Tax=Zingiber officinale TaxID=94328 RepID=A0A8J5FRF7_ZINOF|nr:probable prolyl 4-hydroxylase 3 [Zingiber officinale]KAG6493613.1 hypothetical protein ZIOFF_048605 [Zingiber officinale]
MASSLRSLAMREARGGRLYARMFVGRKTSKSTYFLVLLALLALSLVLLLLLPLHFDDASIPRLHKHFLREQEGFGHRGPQWTEVVSWEPRAFMYHNFLSKEECEHFIMLAKPHMKKSTVIDNSNGKSKDSRVRTSTGTFLHRAQDNVIKAIETRIANYTFIPVEHGEGLQVLHYDVGQKYEPHYDYFYDKFNIKNGGQRVATLLMYLSDVEEGGETVFPNAKVNSSSLPWYNELSDCGKRGLALKPKMGNALLFWSMKPDGTVDPLSLHGSCPVIKGNKWSSTKWMHVHGYH